VAEPFKVGDRVRVRDGVARALAGRPAGEVIWAGREAAGTGPPAWSAWTAPRSASPPSGPTSWSRRTAVETGRGDRVRPPPGKEAGRGRGLFLAGVLPVGERFKAGDRVRVRLADPSSPYAGRAGTVSWAHRTGGEPVYQVRLDGADGLEALLYEHELEPEAG